MSDELENAKLEADRARQALQAAPTDPAAQYAVVVALHVLASRYLQAGNQSGSAGLGTEALAVISGTTAASDLLVGMAENLTYVAAYLSPGAEAVDTMLAGVEVFRRERAAAPGPSIDSKLVWALHNLAARYLQAGRQPESAGLGTEASAVVTETAATGDLLLGMAENLTYVAAYVAPGAEAVASDLVAVNVFRRARAAAPGEVIDSKLVWALHGLAARYLQADRQSESAGLGTEAAAIVTATTATGDLLLGMAENLTYVAAYVVPGAEAVASDLVAVDVFRRARAAAPGDVIDSKLVWALHGLAARYLQAGRQPESAGLGTEAAAIVTATTATGDLLLGMAENLLYLASYLPASTEQVDAGTAGWKVFGDFFRADSTNDVYAQKYGWAETLVIQWRVGIGLPPVILLNPDLPPDGRRHFDDGTPVAALSRNPNQMDVFAVGRNGRVQSTWWNGLWRESFELGGAQFPSGSPIGVLSRSPDYMDLFVVGLDGRVRGNWWHGNWGGWYQLGDKTFPERTTIATMSRSADFMDIFAVDQDGHVWGNWWHGTWRGWYQLGDKAFPPGTTISTLSRSPDFMDIFAVAPDGRVWGNWWHGDWRGWYQLGDLVLPAGTTIATMSRSPDFMDIFAVDRDGKVWGNWWHGTWRGWYPMGDKTFPAGTTISTLSRSPDFMDIFAVDRDGKVWGNWWHGTWRDWYQLGDRTFPAGAPIATVSRNDDQMDIFAVRDGGIDSAWWHGDWKPWFRLPWAVHSFTRTVESGGLAALGGWATVSILDDGSTRLYGHLKNSGIDSYGVSLPMLVRPAGNAAVLAFHHYADVGAHEVHEWDEWHPAHSEVLTKLRNYQHGQLESDMQYSSGIADAVRDTLAWTTTIVVGWTPAGLAIAPIVMLGAGLYSLFDEGSMLPGLMAFGTAVWLTGPTGMLVAYPVQQWVGDATTSRGMRENEITWARQIFGEKLPYDDIRITKLIGKNDRAFAGLVHNGKITINMGPEGYDDPFMYRVAIGEKKWGETFAHELTHAWQLEHYDNSAEIARVLARFLQDATGNPYVYGSGAPWHAYNPEAQANIVSDWYARNLQQSRDDFGLGSPQAIADLNFHYIRDHIRTGTT